MMFVVATPFGPAGIAVYGGLLAVLFVALYTQPVATPATPVRGSAALRT
jgi:hypothetical protein